MTDIITKMKAGKKHRKKCLVIGIFLVVTLLFVNSVAALGVTPGRRTINYDSSAELEYENQFSFTILNPSNEDMRVRIGVNGDFANSMEFIGIDDEDTGESEESKDKEDYTVTLSAGQASREIFYVLDIDEDDLEPGENKINIVITKMPLSEEDDFSAVLSVVSEVIVNYPYPGKYIESAIEIKESGKNQTTEFSIPVINRGEDDIDNFKAEIDVADKHGNNITELESETISIKSMQRQELDVDWIANVPMGVYQATIALIYDDETATYYKTFKVGDVDVEVFDVFADDFELGNIVTLKILVENKWDDVLKEVYANLILYNESNTKVVDIKSAPYDIGALEEVRIPLHWDTLGIEKGSYKGKIKILSREGLSVEREIFAEINEHGIGVELESGGFVLDEETPADTTVLITLILLGGAAAAWIIFRRFPKK